MNTIQNYNGTAFNAKLKIIKTKDFKIPHDSFDFRLKCKKPAWNRMAKFVGSDSDTITIRLGDNNPQKSSENLVIQKITTSAKIKNLKIKEDTHFSFLISDGCGAYIDSLDSAIFDFLKFAQRASKCKISKN